MSRFHGLGGAPHTLTQPEPTPAQLSSIDFFLTTGAYAPATIAAYTAAVHHFHSYCRHHGRHSSPSLFDRCLREYICRLFYRHGARNRQLAVNTVYGLYMLQPELRGKLSGSEQLLAGWKRQLPSVSHRPVTWPITIAVARTMAANGCSDCAVATLVAFDGLLRVGELVAMAVADVSLPGDSRRGSSSRTTFRSASWSLQPSSRRSSTSAFIRLAVTKTGANQTAEISNPDIVALLERYMATRPPDSRLFPFPTACPTDCFRAVLRSACHALDLSDLGFTPHSLRHGGATHAHVHMGLSIEHVLHRGRWRSNSSARTYLQSGTAALITTQLSSRAQLYVQGLQSHWYTALWADCFQTHPQPI